MYNIPTKTVTRLRINRSVEGEPLEHAIRRLINNGDEKFSSKSLIHLPPSEGVHWATDVRTDKWEKGIEQTDKVTAKIRENREKKRQERKDALDEANGKKPKTETPKTDGGDSGSGTTQTAD